MSYILDALRKSDKKRRHITVPELLEDQVVTQNKPKKRLIWPYLLFAALILNAGIFALWIGTWYSKNPGLIQQPSSRKQIESVAAQPMQDTPHVTLQEAASPSATTKTAIPEKTIVNGKKLSSTDNSALKHVESRIASNTQKQPVQAKADLQMKINPKPVQTTDIEKSPAPHTSQQEQNPVATPVPPKPQTVIPAAVPAENKVYKLKELPVSVRKDLPVISIAALLYSSNPVSRMVRVNDQMMREGEVLTSGLKLEEIASDGVIFSYQSYRFFVGMK